MSKKPKPMKAFAAFNPDTGECMAPTIRASLGAVIHETDRFYLGCPIYECELAPKKKVRS